MIAGTFTIGYAIAALDSLWHCPLVLGGLPGRASPSRFCQSNLTPGAGITTVTKDLVWWIPLGLILLAAFRQIVS